MLVAISLLAAIVVAIPLSIAAAHRPTLGKIILGIAAILQTVPSLALLVQRVFELAERAIVPRGLRITIK